MAFSCKRNFLEEVGEVFYKNRYIVSHSLAGNGSFARPVERDGLFRAVFVAEIRLSNYVCETDSTIG